MDAETLTGAEEIKLAEEIKTEDSLWRLSDEVCEELRLEAFNGLKSIPRRGAEIGGILTQSRDNAASLEIQTSEIQTGEIQPDEIQTAENAADSTLVTGSELIPSEHLFGPSYRLSPADIERIEARCNELRDDPHHKLIGLFRSSVRDILEITPDDLELLDQTVPDAQLFVLIKPSPFGDGLIRLFQRDESHQWSQTGEIEVCNKIAPPPRVPAPLISAAFPYTPRPAEPAQAERPSNNDLERFPPKRRGAPLGMPLIAGICIVVALLVTLGVFQFVRRSPGPAAQVSLSGNRDLGLQLLQQQDSLRLTWNKNLSSVLSATRGMLVILDGGQQRLVSLDSGQVALGVIYYSPISDDINFNLYIKDNSNRTMSGTARILIGTRSRGSTPAEPPTGDIARAPALTSPARKVAPPQAGSPIKATPGQAVPAKAAPANASQANTTQANAIPIKEAPGKEVQRSVPPSPPVTQPQLAAAPPVFQPLAQFKNPVQPSIPAPTNPSETARPAANPETSNRPVIQTPPVSNSTPPPPVVTTAPRRETPPPQPPTVTAQLSVPNIQPDNGDTPTPARPVTKVMPSTRAVTGPSRTAAIQVTVQVSIDDKGRVTEAHALPGTSPYWASRSTEAARQWRYEPAMLHGQRVPSISTIVFRFAAP